MSYALTLLMIFICPEEGTVGFQNIFRSLNLGLVICIETRQSIQVDESLYLQTK